EPTQTVTAERVAPEDMVPGRLGPHREEIGVLISMGREPRPGDRDEGHDQDERAAESRIPAPADASPEVRPGAPVEPLERRQRDHRLAHARPVRPVPKRIRGSITPYRRSTTRLMPA